MRTEPDEENTHCTQVLKPTPIKNKKLVTFYHLKSLLKPTKPNAPEQNTKDWIHSFLCFGNQNSQE